MGGKRKDPDLLPAGEGSQHSAPAREMLPPAWVSLSKPMDPTPLVAVIGRLIRENDLCKTNREDVIGVLMRCGAFNDVSVGLLASVIDRYLKEETP